MELDRAQGLAEMQRALLDGLISQKHMAVGVCDAKGVLVMLSPAMEELLGVSYRPIAHAEWPDVFFLHDENGVPLRAGQDPLARVLRGAAVTDQVISVLRPGRPPRWGLASGITLVDERGHLTGAAVFVLDITARKKASERLDELRDRLVETVNHEVRTPLATITGHVELLDDSGIDVLPESTQRSLRAIGRAAARLGDVVDTISDLADRSQRGPRRKH